MEFAWYMLLLLMKLLGRTDFAFVTGLVACWKDYIEDGEWQGFFEGSLSLQLAAQGIQSLLFLACQIQKEHPIEDLLNFVIMLKIRALLKSSFLKQHKSSVP